MPKIEKVLYTGKTRTSGGREGASRSDDGRLDIKLSSPGSTGEGTNPEQLLQPGGRPASSARSALVAAKRKIALPKDLAVDAESRFGKDWRRLFAPGPS